MNRIARFEALAEGLVEGTFARLFAGHLHPLEVATHLARAMEDYLVTAPDGKQLAPTHYWVYLSSEDVQSLAADRPTLASDLVEHVARLAHEAGLALTAAPLIAIEASEDVPAHSVRIEARWLPPTGDPTGITTRMKPEDEAVVRSAIEEEPARSPFLIVQGQSHVELSQPVVSIGRALDNDVILEDSRVSRHHAQLRRRYGRYVLYDLGSSGGTTIGGYPVQECVLQPGDVISFAGVDVIYGEDVPARPPETKKGDTSDMGGEDGTPSDSEG